MSAQATLPTAILETVLIRLAALFMTGAAGDPAAARHAALQMLAAYHPETPEELRLAASIIAFSFQSLEALAQAATPDMPLTRILRLRGGAVTLSRESAKAERRLAQLQTARQTAVPPHQPEIHPEPAEPAPQVEKSVALVQETAEIAVAAQANNQTWTQAQDERQREARIAASLQRAEARIAALANAPTQALPGHHSAS